MPPPKKQKKNISTGRGQNNQLAIQSLRTPASQRLSGEVLQIIFRNLQFNDLIRCMRVCTQWTRYLPGDDSKLHEALFLRYKGKPLKEAMGVLNVRFVVTGRIDRSRPGLPQPQFKLGIRSYGSKSMQYHPMIRCSDIVNRHFHPRDDYELRYDSFGNRMYPWNGYELSFDSFGELERKTKYAHGEHEDGNWKHMFLCIPPTKSVKMHIGWKPMEDNIWHPMLRLKVLHNEQGVKLRDYVNALRQTLNHAEDEIVKFASRIPIVDDDMSGLSD